MTVNKSSCFSIWEEPSPVSVCFQMPALTPTEDFGCRTADLFIGLDWGLNAGRHQDAQLWLCNECTEVQKLKHLEKGDLKK